MIQFTLNGQMMEYGGDTNLPLLTYLREEQGIISPKDGCAPQAACGCCVVQVDDKAVLSCVTKMEKVAGKSVMTTEGLGEYRQNVFANAFVKEGGVQCGFCIPGLSCRRTASSIAIRIPRVPTLRSRSHRICAAVPATKKS